MLPMYLSINSKSQCVSVGLVLPFLIQVTDVTMYLV